MKDIKTKKIGSSFTKEISYILANEVKNPKLKFVTVTDCEVTNDLSYAKVYFTCLKDIDIDELTNELNKCANFIELYLAKNIEIRKMPQISFHYDNSYNYGKNIEAKLKEIQEEN